MRWRSHCLQAGGGVCSAARASSSVARATLLSLGVVVVIAGCSLHYRADELRRTMRCLAADYLWPASLLGVVRSSHTLWASVKFAK